MRHSVEHIYEEARESTGEVHRGEEMIKTDFPSKECLVSIHI